MSEASQRTTGDRWVLIGGVIAALGALAAVVALVPLVVSDVEPMPLLWFLAIGGVGIGVGLCLWGLVRAARSRSRYLGDG